MAEHIRSAIEACVEQRDQAATALAYIQRGEWRHFLGVEGKEPVEITDSIAARERETIERMNRLIAAYEAYLA